MSSIPPEVYRVYMTGTSSQSIPMNTSYRNVYSIELVQAVVTTKSTIVLVNINNYQSHTGSSTTLSQCFCTLIGDGERALYMSDGDTRNPAFTYYPSSPFRLNKLNISLTEPDGNAIQHPLDTLLVFLIRQQV